ncbi:hypothetical protein [Nocardia sp. NPDC057227]|uniref:hypothetical protein n=1 Tax=Nocardia sp. NPDC057227 TaxID=3346056 RepID=UPI00363BBC4A
MLYLANPNSEAARAAMTAGSLGCLDTPRQSQLPDTVTWAADNGCFAAGTEFDIDRWFGWLERRAAHAPRCLFATAPDILADAAATITRSSHWLARIRDLGYLTALVAQDGLEHLDIPWRDFDVLFIGGTTSWKLGPAAADLIAEAQRRDRWVHMGRVNTRRRLRYAHALGVDSVDGTCLTYAPDVNLHRLLSWLAEIEHQPALFSLATAG